MAKKEEKKEEAKEERIFTIPLRMEYLKAPDWKRAKKTVSTVRDFLFKHMKTRDVKLGKELNELLWAKGAKSPPHSISVHVRVVDGISRANLVGAEIVVPEKKEKKEKKEEAPKEEEEKANIQRAEPKRKKSRKKPKSEKKAKAK